MLLMAKPEKQQFPAGRYECPKCGLGVEVFVDLTDTPTHRCGAGRRMSEMVYKGSARVKAGNSVRGLDTSS